MRWERQQRYMDREYLKISNPTVPDTGRWANMGLSSDEERLQPDELVNSDSEASDHMEPYPSPEDGAGTAKRGHDNYEKRTEYMNMHRDDEKRAHKEKKKVGKLGFFKAAAAGSNAGGDSDYVYLNDPQRGKTYPKRTNFGTCRANVFPAINTPRTWTQNTTTW